MCFDEQMENELVEPVEIFDGGSNIPVEVQNEIWDKLPKVTFADVEKCKISKSINQDLI